MNTGQTEEEFLKNYNIHDFSVPLASIDICIFAIDEDALKVLLVKRAEHPALGKWSLPGGFIDLDTDKNLEATVQRKLVEKTGVKAHYVEQIETVGNKKRDPRGWSMTVLYFSLIAFSEAETQTERVEAARWVPVDEALKMKLAFDHRALLGKAVERLRSKVSYTTLPAHVLPGEFTLAELQNAYEVIMERAVDKKAFRRRIEAAGFLEETGSMRQDGGRPAKLYRVIKDADTHFYNRAI